MIKNDGISGSAPSQHTVDYAPTVPEIRDIMLDVRRLLANPAQWVKGTDRADHGIYYAYCLGGAIRQVASASWAAGVTTPKADAVGGVLSELTPAGFVNFNDDPDTTHADLMDFIDRAIADAPAALDKWRDTQRRAREEREARLRHEAALRADHAAQVEGRMVALEHTALALKDAAIELRSFGVAASIGMERDPRQNTDTISFKIEVTDEMSEHTDRLRAISEMIMQAFNASTALDMMAPSLPSEAVLPNGATPEAWAAAYHNEPPPPKHLDCKIPAMPDVLHHALPKITGALLTDSAKVIVHAI